MAILKNESKNIEKKRVLIFLPSLPYYRIDFFYQLKKYVNNKYDLFVVHGNKSWGKNIFYKKPNKFKTKSCFVKESIIFNYRLSWQKGLFKIFKEYNPEAVILLFHPGNITHLLICLLCWLRNIPFALWACGFKRPEIFGIRLSLKEKISSFFIKVAKAHICYGSKYAKELKDIGVDESKIFIAQNTIDVEAIMQNHHKFEKFELRKKLNIGQNDIVFIFVGVLIAEKNLDKAIEAMAYLRDEGYKIKFLIIGEGKERQYLESLVMKYNVNEVVYFVEALFNNNLAKYLLAADVFVLPGAGGLAVNEAMAYGLPIISTIGDGTIIDLLKENINGYIINNPTTKEIFTLFKKFIKQSPLKRVNMGLNSKKILKESALLSNMICNYIKAIDFLLTT